MKDRSNLIKFLIILALVVAVISLIIIYPLFPLALKSQKAPQTTGAGQTKTVSTIKPTATSAETTETAETTPPVAVTPVIVVPAPASLPVFNSQSAMAWIDHLATSIGPRREGSIKEKEAAEYIKAEFVKLGYQPVVQTFPLPDGNTSQNIIAVKTGTSPGNRVVIGGHYDTKLPSPGADDNASGVGTILALAEAVKDHPLKPTVYFIAFGAEEMIDADPDHHHYGSRYYVNTLAAQELSEIAGMISVDMIGVGRTFYIGSLGREPRVVANTVIAEAGALGQQAYYFTSREWSDHEPFEKKGIPTAWLEWKEDPYYHKASDTYDKIKVSNIDLTGRVLLQLLLHLDESRLAEWKS